LYYVTLILISLHSAVHFILIKPVFSDHLSYVTLVLILLHSVFHIN
jgi:hypothetical protein